MNVAGWVLATTMLVQAQVALANPVRTSEAVQALRLAADHIETEYVDADKASKIAAILRKEAGALRRRPKTDQALADDITSLLRSLSADQHFSFRYSATAMPADIFAVRSSSDTEAAALRTARSNNFGVLKVERLPGNIGLLDLDAFSAPGRMRRPLAAAMEFLRHCDAMIVDLRYNGGGDGRGAALAASYFLPETPVQLLSRLESRDPKQTVELTTEGALEAPRFLNRPVYVLTGPATFSAAEFLASALQHKAGATVVGVKTRGGANPSMRIRLTPHFGIMLPVLRGVELTRTSAEIIPDQPTTAREALVHARRLALTSLLAEHPRDVLSEVWKKALEDLAPRPAAKADGAGL